MITKKQKEHRINKAPQMQEGGGYPLQQASPTKPPMQQWADWGSLALYQKLEEILLELKEINKKI